MQMFVIIINILVGVVSLLTTGISVLIYSKINKEEDARKSSTDALWEKRNEDIKVVHKNEKNIVKISTSLDIDIED